MLDIQPLNDDHHIWARQLIEDQWGSTRMVSRGRLHDMTTLPGFVALIDDQRLGLVTYRLDGDECEIMSLDSRAEGQGIGSALLKAVQQVARAAGCRRLVLITTNDNTHALRFYQRRGWRLAALHVGAVDDGRRLKPEIPLIGHDDIPIHDEIELEMQV
ncbi:MAG: GNAT family N-acetyltransferase [Chloroflexi bacterium]|nr:GNAT family N-acetyltransferase [Chloroflexota bacterium]